MVGVLDFGAAYLVAAIVMFVVSVAWFYAGHLLAFLALGRIIKKGDPRTSAKAALLVFGGYAGIIAAAFAIIYGFGLSESPLLSGQYGILFFFLTYALGGLVYLAFVAWAAHRFYELPVGYATLAALGIGSVYFIATFVLSLIAQMIIFMVIMISAASFV
jgi:hypothetical protein